MLTLRKRFGVKLRGIRIGRKLTQEKFAEMLEMSVDFLSLMERGISAPSFETLEKIGRKLQMPVSKLFE